MRREECAVADQRVLDSAKSLIGKKVINYINKDPETNIPKLVDWVIEHDKKGHVTQQAKLIKKQIDNKDGNWWNLIMSLWSDIDDGEREALFTNVVVNATMVGGPRQQRVSFAHDCNVPWAILMDPTSACNLHCTGCWAADYGNKLNMTLEELDDIIEQGEEMGTYMYIYSGGEPLVRKDDIITLCERHPECQFLAFTNSTLIDEKFADDMLRVKNFVPAISIEGNEQTTDARRGQGTYKKIMHAMQLLRDRKLAFGASVCYTRANTEVIGSEQFFDDLIGLGCKFAWFFTYMPVGADAPTDLIATADQRKFMYDQIRGFRKTKPLFTLDFWNDGEYVGGCIAGGRAYLHINANGDIEPCAFIHYSDSNIREKSLLEAYESPLFEAYRAGQPFSGNMLRPCPLLDNKDALAGMVDKSGAHSTDVASPEYAHDLCAKCHDAADAWKPVADDIWGDRTYTGHMKPKNEKEAERLSDNMPAVLSE